MPVCWASLVRKPSLDRLALQARGHDHNLDVFWAQGDRRRSVIAKDMVSFWRWILLQYTIAMRQGADVRGWLSVPSDQTGWILGGKIDSSPRRKSRSIRAAP